MQESAQQHFSRIDLEQCRGQFHSELRRKPFVQTSLDFRAFRRNGTAALAC